MSGHGTDHGNCSERHDDLAAYALGALAPDEAVALERHLAECDDCSERLRWLQPAVDLVPASVTQLEPPPELKQSLMAAVREESSFEASVADGPREDAKQPTAGTARSRGPFARLRYRLLGDGPLRPALAGFAAICLVVAGVLGYGLRGGGDDVTEYAALPTSPKVSAHGTVSVEDGSGTLVVENMADIPQDEVYQVWVEQGKNVIPSEIFVVDHNGHGTATIPAIPDGADRVMVTREPAGGSETPRSAPVLQAEL